MDLATNHSPQISRGCGLLSASHAHQLRPARALNYRCHSYLLRHIDLRAIRRILFSIDLDAFTALIPVQTSIPMTEHQNKANFARTLEIYRGLTAYEEPAPPAGVFSE